jgi:hypothetical protein
MDSVEMLKALAKGAYLFDEMGHYVLKNTDGTVMKRTDDYGRDVEARFTYDEIENGLMRHHYIEQDNDDASVYRISHDGLRAARSP